MLGEGRDFHRSGWNAIALLLGALTLLPAAAFGQEKDPRDVSQSVRQFQTYTRALNRFGSAQSAQWRQGINELRTLPAHLWKNDVSLVRQAPTSAVARRELYRRSQIYTLSLVFTERYNHVRWQRTWESLRKLGPDAVEYLCDKLVRQLLTATRRDVWDHVRFYLVECGEVARRQIGAMVDGLVADIAGRERGKGEFASTDQLVRCLQVLINFGEATRAKILGLARHESVQARSAVARALGESRDPTYIDTLTALAADEHWRVRAAAATGLGRCRYKRAASSAVLAARLRREGDPVVRQKIIEAMGELRARDAVGALISELNESERDWQRTMRRIAEEPKVRKHVEDAFLQKNFMQSVMVSLWKVTGRRLNTPANWRAWWGREQRRRPR